MIKYYVNCLLEIIVGRGPHGLFIRVKNKERDFEFAKNAFSENNREKLIEAVIFVAKLGGLNVVGRF